MERDRGYTDKDMAEVSDSPERTEEEFARATSFAEAFPDLAESLRKGVMVEIVGTNSVSVRLGDDVLAHYRAFGEDWEARLNADLRKVRGLAR